MRFVKKRGCDEQTTHEKSQNAKLAVNWPKCVRFLGGALVLGIRRESSSLEGKPLVDESMGEGVGTWGLLGLRRGNQS
jgi:hypothetical protein